MKSNFKLIKSSYLNRAYKNRIRYESNFFPAKFTPHGSFCTSNWGGYLIVLSSSGDAAILVETWGGEKCRISDILEIEYRRNENLNDELAPCVIINYFTGSGKFYSDPVFLDNFLRT